MASDTPPCSGGVILLNGMNVAAGVASLGGELDTMLLALNTSTVASMPAPLPTMICGTPLPMFLQARRGHDGAADEGRRKCQKVDVGVELNTGAAADDAHIVEYANFGRAPARHGDDVLQAVAVQIGHGDLHTAI